MRLGCPGLGELYDAEKKNIEVLGCPVTTGTRAKGPQSSSKDRAELTRKERNAAQALGYSEQNREVSCPNDIPE